MIWDSVPLFATALMSLSAGIVGSLIYWQRRILISETLSHGTFPGVALGTLFSMQYFGAILSSIGAMGALRFLKQRGVKHDAALTLVLAFFMGVGVLIASVMQIGNPDAFRSVSIFFYGQSATLLDHHVTGYAVLLFVVILSVVLMYGRLRVLLFDPTFAQMEKVKRWPVNLCLSACLIATIVFGIRSVGMILMMGMLIIPPCIATLCTKRLKVFICLSAFFGVLGSCLGNALSLILPSFPTGPLILLSTGSFFGLILIGKAIFRRLSQLQYRNRCIRENLLKQLWCGRGPIKGNNKYLRRLRREGCLCENNILTEKGRAMGARITRAHRLWELYLSKELGFSGRIIHLSATRIEHIISCDVDAELSNLLGDPKKDPHNQPIPQKGARL